jgi:large subunit ribosomal protein L23
MSKTLLVKPRVSEKAYAMGQDLNVYVMDVPKSVSKQEIMSAIKAQFDVTVISVNTTVLKGKAKRTVRKGGRPVKGRQSDVKKAYVTLKEGDTITVFASEEEAADKPKDEKEAKPKAAAKPAAAKEEAVEAEAKPKRRFGRKPK